MTENQFKFDRDTVATNLKTPIVYDEKRMSIGEVLECLNIQDMEIKALRKELHLAHMSSMFSTVKSFKGDISKRYKYDIAFNILTI